MNRWATMQERVADYLSTRRRLGFALRIEGEQLQRFARFADARAHRGPITVGLALAAYANLRNRHLPLPPDAAFFLRDDGRALRYPHAMHAFQRIRAQLGWNREIARRPRLYDLRHTFACNRLLGWYREGIDVHWVMPLLTTYMGHAKVTDTYWYLTAVPALMAIAAERFESLAQPNGEEVAP